MEKRLFLQFRGLNLIKGYLDNFENVELLIYIFYINYNIYIILNKLMSFQRQNS